MQRVAYTAQPAVADVEDAAGPEEPFPEELASVGQLAANRAAWPPGRLAAWPPETVAVALSGSMVGAPVVVS
ncbi:hypothetical protein ACFV2H_19300 [Streptomyces sp. NPDC059629]|uniref:hypothetical protein n=1 Tax=Streptomyces sp. NPDC059629 TaxID=3346889 RepID=UPI003681CCDB